MIVYMILEEYGHTQVRLWLNNDKKEYMYLQYDVIIDESQRPFDPLEAAYARHKNKIMSFFDIPLEII